VVVGGGIAGLAAAYRLIRLAPAAEVTLIEADDRLGGKIVTERIDGFLVEGGPDSFLAVKPRGVGLCQELGLGERLQGTTPRPHRAFVLRRGRLHELPEGISGLVPTRFRPLLGSRLLSPLGTARLALDAVLPPRRGERDEALAAFVRRRLGSEAYDWLVEPLMAGIYAGDGDRLSLAATFPHLRDGELRYGGLIRGVLAAKRDAPATPVGRPAFLTPAAGLGALVDRLEAELRAAGVRLIVGRRVEAVAPGATSRFSVRLEDGGALPAEAVVLAAPAFAAAGLLSALDPALAAELDGIPHASSAIVSLAYRRAEVPHPLDAHGYVVPRAEGRPVLACTWTSAKWAGRAPDGSVLLRVFLGRFGQEETLAGPDDNLIALARAELRSTLGVEAAPTLVRVHRWRWGMPQFVLGHRERLTRIAGRLADHPGLALAGAAYRGVGLPDCIASGEAAADAIAAGLGRTGARPIAAGAIRAAASA